MVALLIDLFRVFSWSSQVFFPGTLPGNPKYVGFSSLYVCGTRSVLEQLCRGERVRPALWLDGLSTFSGRNCACLLV